MSLSGKTLKASYVDLLQMDNSNSGVDETARIIKDGEGTKSALSLSDDVVNIRPNNHDTTSSLQVKAINGDVVMKVDTTNQLVYGSDNIVNTQYAYFGMSQIHNTANAAGYHYPLIFGGSSFSGAASMVDQDPNFGNGTDPATTLTTADANDQRADDLIKLLWYVPDAMSIDSVTAIEGASAATGDTTRFHLMSYTFNSGSTSCLTSGTLVAHNSDTTNAGCEQAYKSTFTIDSASISAGKVLMAFFESDSVNSDYMYQVIIKYHLT
tara:strand:- start:301 stop:1101 length:801 start_codon:yes stop_codon:yes gene_type:complete